MAAPGGKGLSLQQEFPLWHHDRTISKWKLALCFCLSVCQADDKTVWPCKVADSRVGLGKNSHLSMHWNTSPIQQLPPPNHVNSEKSRNRLTSWPVRGALTVLHVRNNVQQQQQQWWLKQVAVAWSERLLLNLTHAVILNSPKNPEHSKSRAMRSLGSCARQNSKKCDIIMQSCNHATNHCNHKGDATKKNKKNKRLACILSPSSDRAHYAKPTWKQAQSCRPKAVRIFEDSNFGVIDVSKEKRRAHEKKKNNNKQTSL